MSNWKELGDGECFRILPDGTKAMVIDLFVPRVVVGDRVVDDLYFSVADAMKAVDDWVDGKVELNWHSVERHWLGDDKAGYKRKSKIGELKATPNACGRWSIDRVGGKCFATRKEALDYADLRLP
jgi:hypothetical protein